jgi:hypothetical protein
MTKKSEQQDRKQPSKKTRGSRRSRSFPASTFEEALVLAQAIVQFAASQKVRRLTLFDNLKKAPDSGPSRQLITNSSKYGLTTGSYKAEHLELTAEGCIAAGTEVNPTDQLKSRFELAINQIAPFKALYEHLKGNKLPAVQVMRDFLVEHSYKDGEVAECVDTFILNAKFLGLLRTVAGAERLLSIEHIVEEMPRSGAMTGTAQPLQQVQGGAEGKISSDGSKPDGWNQVCFYITPIGEAGSEQRQHSDLFLSSIVERAVEEFGLKVIRADQIAKAGIITKQVIEHLVRSRLVIADLSFHNPNVFYELCLRHVCRLPTVQIIRASDAIPFDLDQLRTVKIQTESIYTLVPQLETYRSEIANQVRRALADPDAVDNPVSICFPQMKFTI